MRTKGTIINEIKADLEAGTLEGYGHIFREPPDHDSDGDAVRKGAFAGTIKQHFQADNRVRILWQHDKAQPMGVPTELAEDSMGLYFKARVTQTRANEERLALIRDGVVDTMSIGFDVGEFEMAKDAKVQSGWRKGKPVRIITEFSRLWEISPVTFAADEQARVRAKDRNWITTESGVVIPWDDADLLFSLHKDTPAEGEMEQERIDLDAMAEAKADEPTPEPTEEPTEAPEAKADDGCDGCEECACKDAPEPADEKAGRVLSAKNEGKLKQALELLSEVVQSSQPAEAQESDTDAKGTDVDPPEAEVVENTKAIQRLDRLASLLENIK